MSRPSPVMRGGQCGLPCCQAMLTEYLDFQREQRGLSPATLWVRAHHVQHFFVRGLQHCATPAELATLHPSTVHAYVLATAEDAGPGLRRHLVSSVRSFLRYAYLKGYTPRELTSAVPVLPTYRLDRLPRGLAWPDVERLLAAPDRTTRQGRRDYAMLMLMATYGVRISQVVQLQLTDLAWEAGVIHFPGVKRGTTLTLPLVPRVADALLAYLADRTAQPFATLFLTLHRPIRPMQPNNTMTWMIKQQCRAAGIPGRYGTHAIRHAVATRLEAAGTPLKTIADLLGHRSVDTTLIYTKVDVEKLRTVAVPWPVPLAAEVRTTGEGVCAH